MKWSWNAGKLAGIDLRIHATFLLLLGWVAVSHWAASRNLEGVMAGLAFIVALFACVLLHELGHALAARRYGIATRDITLLPIGGLARLERMPEKPYQEFWVAIAGPAVNLVIAALLYFWLILTNAWSPVSQMSVSGGPFMERLLIANISLVIFNLIPAFPMDGGRILRALLASRLEYVKATRIAAGIGQALAFGLGFIGLFANPFLLFIALFVWIGASQEANATEMKAALAGTPVRAAMITEFRVLQPGDTLEDAVRHILQGSQQDFPVVDRDRVLGVLTRADLLVALTRGGQGQPVSSVMRSDFLVADSSEMLEGIFQRLEQCNCHTLPVLQHGRLAGLVTMENLGEYLLIQAAMRKAAPPAELAMAH